MAVPRDGYTRLIGWLKILLPLAALGLLSTVFLLSETQAVRNDLPFADVGSSTEGLSEGVQRPTFAGATEDGDLISFVAETARPVDGGIDTIEAEEVLARIDLTTGGTITFRSDTARLAEAQGLAQLNGGVVVTSATGYRIETETLSAGLDTLFAETDGEVRGEGPAGRFTAGRMEIRAIAPDDTVRLRFSEGVKLVYLPATD